MSSSQRQMQAELPGSRERSVLAESGAHVVFQGVRFGVGFAPAESETAHEEDFPQAVVAEQAGRGDAPFFRETAPLVGGVVDVAFFLELHDHFGDRRRGDAEHVGDLLVGDGMAVVSQRVERFQIVFFPGCHGRSSLLFAQKRGQEFPAALRICFYYAIIIAQTGGNIKKRSY